MAVLCLVVTDSGTINTKLTPPPPGYFRTADTFSDSGHSERSSRSSLVSNSSFDLIQDERRQRHSISAMEASPGGGRMERRATLDPDQYSLG